MFLVVFRVIVDQEQRRNKACDCADQEHYTGEDRDAIPDTHESEEEDDEGDKCSFHCDDCRIYAVAACSNNYDTKLAIIFQCTKLFYQFF